MVDQLAVHGGQPVRQRPWPRWPVVNETNEDLLLKAFRSGRWAVSGMFTGTDPFEVQFARRFADFHHVPYCVPTCHGSSALTVALEALGVGPGQEVLVPGLTWVACASAVSGIGGVPILVDIEPDTLCISADAAEAAITDRTAAIMVVHSFGSTADLDRFADICRRRSIKLLEDCSQAHGARWGDRRVGSIGDVAAFSFQQTKLLTCGEGGATLTGDPALWDRLQQLRADGRRYTARPRIGHLDLDEIGTVQGRNYCMSELQAAILLEGLDRLDDENRRRRDFVAAVEHGLAECPGVTVQARPERLVEPSFYHLCLRFDLATFGGATIDEIAVALKHELQLFAIDPVDTPLNSNRLYNPLLSPRTPPGLAREYDPRRFDLPAADAARACCLTIPNNALLGDESDVADILAAIEKIRRLVPAVG